MAKMKLIRLYQMKKKVFCVLMLSVQKRFRLSYLRLAPKDLIGSLQSLILISRLHLLLVPFGEFRYRYETQNTYVVTLCCMSVLFCLVLCHLSFHYLFPPLFPSPVPSQHVCLWTWLVGSYCSGATDIH